MLVGSMGADTVVVFFWVAARQAASASITNCCSVGTQRGVLIL